MAIDRTPWNALVDDDGSGLTGSVWNKDKIKTVILDPVDASLALGVKPYYTTSTTTGVQNAWDPGIKDDTVILWDGAADLTVNGIVGGVTGRRLTIRNVGGSGFVIWFPFASSAAAVGLRFAGYVSSGPTPVAPYGTVTWVYDGTYWRPVAHEQGAWITPPFSAANFFGSGGAWTVEASDILSYSYRLEGRALTMSLYIVITSVAAGSTALRTTIPNGWTIVRNATNPITIRDNSSSVVVLGYALVHTAIGPNILQFSLASDAAFQASTNNTGIFGQLTFEVN